MFKMRVGHAVLATALASTGAFLSACTDKLTSHPSFDSGPARNCEARMAQTRNRQSGPTGEFEKRRTDNRGENIPCGRSENPGASKKSGNKGMSNLPTKTTTSESANARKAIFSPIMDMLNSSKDPYLEEASQLAITRMTTMIQLQPHNSMLFATRASYFKQAKQFQLAIEDYSKAIDLGKNTNSLSYMWYEGRAHVYDTMGRESAAIADYSEAITIEPRCISAHYSRGRIYNTRKMYVEALADFNYVIDSHPGWNADIYYSRAVANLNLDSPLASAKDFKYFLDSDKWSHPTAPYAVLLGYVSFRKAGKHLDAQALLATAKEHLKCDTWPNVILQYLYGKCSEDKVISTARGTDDLTEAHFYIGIKHLFDSRIEDAARHLTWVVEHGNVSFLDYDLAKHEMQKLSKE